jgi:hypothetical protein
VSAGTADTALLEHASIAALCFLTATYSTTITVQIEEMSAAGVPIDASRVAAITKAYLSDNAPELLEENGGHFKIGETWCLGVLHEMNYSKRRCTTQSAKLPADWELKGERLEHQVSYARYNSPLLVEQCYTSNALYYYTAIQCCHELLAELVCRTV